MRVATHRPSPPPSPPAARDRTRPVLGLALAVLGLLAAGAAEAAPQELLPGQAIPQFVDPLPIPPVVTGTDLTIRMCEFDAHVLPTGVFAAGEAPRTRVWGYVAGPCPSEVRDTYIGPIVVATRGVPTRVTWVNELGRAADTGVVFWPRSVDQTLHWADPLRAGEAHGACARLPVPPLPGDDCWEPYEGPIPAVVHLHGGEVPPDVDGGPGQWFTSDGRHGPSYHPGPGGGANASVFTYPNAQEAAPLWIHDHALGVTRLNVHAGLAGGWLIVDPANPPPSTLPGPAELVPLVVQDRSFDTDGQLFFTAGAAGGILWALNPEHPYWNPEFVGEAIAVNGRVWPYLEVEPRRYRFLVLNGSSARAYELFLTDPATNADGPSLWVIGNDGGYLDRPVALDAARGHKLAILPGERYEVLVDFGGLEPGATLLLRNVARTPYPFGEPAHGATTGRVLQLRVTPCASGRCGAADASYDPASGAPLRAPMPRLADPAVRRVLTLNEVMGDPEGGAELDPRTGTEYEGGPLEVLLNNTGLAGASPRPFDDFRPVEIGGHTTFVSELPEEGVTELWEFVNLTADAHPIHLHLAQFQVASRQAFDVRRYAEVYEEAFPGGGGCAPGTFCPGFGPPLDYRTGNPDALGGNPEIAPFLRGPARPPGAHESGWKDTVLVPPRQVTRILVRWAPQDPASTAFPFDPSGGLEDGAFTNGYVWHCHILDHEDNEMMRPTAIRPSPLAPPRTFVKGVDY